MAKGYRPPSRFMELLSRALNPNTWGMLHRYDPEWDHYLRVGISLGMLEPIYYGGIRRRDSLSPHTLQFGEHTLWVGNFPYAFGAPLPEGGHPYGEDKPRPSYGTMKLLMKEKHRILREELEKEE